MTREQYEAAMKGILEHEAEMIKNAKSQQEKISAVAAATISMMEIVKAYEG